MDRTIYDEAFPGTSSGVPTDPTGTSTSHGRSPRPTQARAHPAWLGPPAGPAAVAANPWPGGSLWVRVQWTDGPNL